MVEGELGRISPLERKRLVEWQEQRTRAALGQMLTLLTVVIGFKVTLLLFGIWPVGLPSSLHVVALAVMVGAREAYGQARRLLVEGLAVTLFMLAMVVILIDPAPGWADRPLLALGWVWLLASLGMPLLTRLRSVVVFVLLLVAAAMVFFSVVPTEPIERLTISLYLAMSVAGGMLLRRLRSDMALSHYRITAAVTATANTDALTSLPNRRGWREKAPPMLEDCFENGQPISLLFMDLDHFKRLNDEHGHAAGDTALIRVGTLLKECIGRGLAARLGGEEFVCLLPGMEAQEAVWFAEALRESLMHPPGEISFSGGVAQWHPGESLAELLARGDAAMYRAKEAGRDRVVVG